MPTSRTGQRTLCPRADFRALLSRLMVCRFRREVRPCRQEECFYLKATIVNRTPFALETPNHRPRLSSKHPPMKENMPTTTPIPIPAKNGGE